MTQLSEYLHLNRSKITEYYSNGSELVHLSEDWELLVALIYKFEELETAQDTAFNLLLEYGDLPSVLAQTYHALLSVEGVTAQVADHLTVVSKTVTLVAEKRVQKRPALNNWNTIEAYCRSVIGFKKEQNIMAIFIDEDFAPIRSVQISKGTINNVEAYPREVISRGLQLGAFGVIIAKNVPTGRLTPKPCEKDFADKLQSACNALELSLADFILVGKTGARSLMRD